MILIDYYYINISLYDYILIFCYYYIVISYTVSQFYSFTIGRRSTLDGENSHLTQMSKVHLVDGFEPA